MKWYPVATEGPMTSAKVGERWLVVLDIGGDLRAYEDQCPHRGNLLSEGALAGRWLVCTGHYWEFDALTGAGPEGSCLTAFPVRRQDGVVEVGIPSADADATA